MEKNIFKYLPIGLCAALAAFFCWFPITDTDIFWHLAAGREIVRTGHFLYTDPFSFTNALPQWTDIHWLFQVTVYGLYALGGFNALIWFKLLAVAAVCALLCGAVRSQRYACASAFVCAVLFYAARYLVCERPVLVTMVCLAAYIYLFERAREGMNARFLWLCVPLQMIWANSQGLYPIGIFVMGAYWIELLISRLQKRERFPLVMTGVLIACAVSCVATPYGIQGLILPFRLFTGIAPAARSLYSLTISENVPLLALSGYDATYRAAVIVAALAACTLFFVNRRRVRPAHVLLFLGFLFLAYSAVRNVLLFFLVLVPIAGYGVTQLEVPARLVALFAARKRQAAFVAAACAALLLAFPVAQHASVAAVYPPHRALSPFRFPEKIADYLDARPVAGEMFNDIRYGGYLIWRLSPAHKVFADGRIMIRRPRFFADYLAICEQPLLFPFAAAKFDITYVIVPSAVFSQYRKLIRFLYRSPDWHLEYTDGTSFLIVKNSASTRPAVDLADPTTVAAIADSMCVQWRDAPYVRARRWGILRTSWRTWGSLLRQRRFSVRNNKTRP